MRRQITEVAQQGGKGNGRRQLKQELGAGGQAGVLMLFDLFIVIQIVDDTEHQREAKDKNGAEVPPGNIRPADEDNGDQDAQNKHEPAHGGGALFGHMPGGAVLLDGLSRLHPAQDGDQELSGNGRDRKRHQRSNQYSHLFNLLGKFPNGDYTILPRRGKEKSIGTPLLSASAPGKKPGDFLPLVQMELDAVDLLIGLMSLACQHHHISGPSL